MRDEKCFQIFFVILSLVLHKQDRRSSVPARLEDFEKPVRTRKEGFPRWLGKANWVNPPCFLLSFFAYSHLIVYASALLSRWDGACIVQGTEKCNLEANYQPFSPLNSNARNSGWLIDGEAPRKLQSIREKKWFLICIEIIGTFLSSIICGKRKLA